jgi:hypothetical protein
VRRRTPARRGREAPGVPRSSGRRLLAGEARGGVSKWPRLAMDGELRDRSWGGGARRLHWRCSTMEEWHCSKRKRRSRGRDLRGGRGGAQFDRPTHGMCGDMTLLACSSGERGRKWD